MHIKLCCLFKALYFIFTYISVPPHIIPFVFPAIEEGSPLQISCNVQFGDLPLSIMWLKEQVPLTASQAEHVKVYRVNEYTIILAISSVLRTDSGNYTCVATNHVRTIAYTAQLSVSGNTTTFILT